MIEKIHVSKDFVSKEDIKTFIDFIDNNIDKFVSFSATFDNPNRHALMFGKDQVFWDKTNTSLEKIKDIEPLVRKYFDKVCREIEKHSETGRELFVTCFWLAKQEKGSFIHSHVDSHENETVIQNPQFTDSSIIYLNTLNDSGKLSFTNLDYSYSPVAGEMIYFPSKGDEFRHEVEVIEEDRYSLVYWLTDDSYFAL